MKKSKSQIKINIPNKEIFTISDLISENPLYGSEISLRVNFSKLVVKREIIELGNLNQKMGRPVNVYTKCPATEKTFKLAQEMGITLNSEIVKFLNSVSPTSTTYNFIPKPRSHIIFE